MNYRGKLQMGGIPKQSDYPDYESWATAQEHWMQSLAPQQPAVFAGRPSISGGFSSGNISGGVSNGSSIMAPPVSGGFSDGRSVGASSISGGKSDGSSIGAPTTSGGTSVNSPSLAGPQEEKKKKKIDPYFALQGITNGLSWLSGKVERNRQNSYQQNQFSTLGQLDPIPVTNFQPTPYNLYAKYGGKLSKYQMGGKFTDEQRKEMAAKVVNIAKDHIKNNSYYEVPDKLKEAALAQGDSPNGCIGGVCSIYKEAGVLDEVNWSNTDFAKKAKGYGFQNNGYGLKGINNLEPGDMVQYLDVGKKNMDKAYPHHSAILVNIDEDGNYHFFDNYNKKERIFPKSEMEDVLSPSKKKNEYQASVYKVNPYTAPKIGTPEDIQAMKDRADKVKYQKESGLNYNYNIREDAKDYNDNTKDIMNKFVNFANNTENINNLIDKTGMSKEDVHDSLLNVFGELGQEGGWQDKTFTGTMGVEGLMEKFLAKTKVGSIFGGGKNKSVGPGQVKFSQIKAEDRKKYGINSPADLYKMDKLLPLMAAQDLENKQVLRNWGKQNTLSDKLIGATDNVNPLQADELKGGVGRWSPYLRNQFSNIQNKKTNIGENDGQPFNEERIDNTVPGQKGLISPYRLDEGSYPDKVFHKTNDNLSRNIGPANYTAPAADVPLNTITLQDLVIKSSKEKLRGKSLPQRKKGGLTPNDARQILHDKEVKNHPLTNKQRRFFGAMSKGHTNYRGK